MSETIASATLPIELEHGLYLDPVKAREFGEALAGEYCFAEPFPHIVIDDFLPAALAQRLLANFPAHALAGDQYYESDYSGHHKRQVFPIDCVDDVRNVFNFFNSASMLQFLEGLTTIDALLPDPYFNGGGYHEISKGGKLGVHADFRINERLHLHRRINVLIYLNKDWKDAYGGRLEIWDRKMTRAIDTIAPLFNRCVIFNTDADSYHGHPEPLNTPEDITRKSVALYYYTASKRVYEDTPAHSTMYVARPQDGSAVKKQVFKLKIQNHAKDWLPPVLHRALRSLKDKRGSRDD